MAPFPVQGIVEGDFVVLLVVVDDEAPAREVAAAIAHHGTGRRVPDPGRPLRVRFRGELLDDETTLAAAGCAPMDVLEVVTG